MASQALLVTLAIVTYYLMGREGGDTRILAWSLVPPVVYSALLVPLFFLAALLLFPRPGNVNPAPQVGSLRLIMTSEVTYAAEYGEGYSFTLSALGGPGNAPKTPSGAGLIDNVLGSGQKNHYTFTYTPGPRDAQGKIRTYTISARPSLECRGKGLKSFFADQTGVIRETRENRPATVHDPPLAG
jgi:hypothetical protein